MFYNLVGKLVPERLIKILWKIFPAARVVGISTSGNHLLRLNRASPLGKMGAIVELPMDAVIFRAVQRSGHWSFDLSRFLREGLDGKQVPEGKAALLDIGAHTGLVTLQVSNITTGSHDYFLFEPIPRHVSAIHRNLDTASLDARIHLIPLALSDRNGISEIFTEIVNHGNSSLWEEVVGPPGGYFRTSIDTVDTAEYFAGFGQEFSRFVIKCDTQGMDQIILSRLPLDVWKRVERAAVEVWALPEVESSDVHTLLDVWRDFRLISWDVDLRSVVSLDEVRDFWTGQTGRFRDLYLVR